MGHDTQRPAALADDPARIRGLAMLLGARRDDAVLAYRLLERLARGDRRAGGHAA